jgi:hypothetical protein
LPENETMPEAPPVHSNPEVSLKVGEEDRLG